MNITLTPYKILGVVLATLLVIATVFHFGMKYQQGLDASNELLLKKATDVFKETYRDSEATQATTLEDYLGKLGALKERLVIREIPKIITRDVYHNECLDADGLRVIESARAGKPDASQPAN